MNTTNPLSLHTIKLWAYSPDSEVAHEYPASTLFDMRHDFFMPFHQSGMAVLLTFLNRRKLFDNNTPGIKHSVSVAIIDATEERIVTSTVVRAHIPRGSLMNEFRVDLPFAYTNIQASHTYKIRVCDATRKEMLCEEEFHMFDQQDLGKEPHLWYSANKGGIIPESAFYLCKAVDGESMEQIQIEFNLTSHFEQEPDIMPEVEIRLYRPDGKVEAKFIRPECVDYDMNEYHVTMPVFIWGNSIGTCYAELLCMEHAIAGFVFSTDGATEIGYYEGAELECLDHYSIDECFRRLHSSRSADENEGTHKSIQDLNDDEFEDALNRFIQSEKEQLDTETVAEEKESEPTNEPAKKEETGNAPLLSSLEFLTGLTSVKAKLTMYEKVVRFNKMRSDHGLPATSIPLHAMFLGSPGTGKTTVAKMIGVMLKRAGVLSKGHVIVKERANLLGPNYSMEETNTLNAIEEAQGGILLIDEAYQLYQPNDPRDPGKFVIETLMTALADTSKRDWMLILAGYPDEMKRMFEINPGLRSRIPDSNIYVFEDFTASELMEIADRYLERNRYSLSPETREALSARLHADYAQRDKSFGNARHVINLIETDILPTMAVRVISTGLSDLQALSEIQACDIPRPVKCMLTARPRIGYCA